MTEQEEKEIAERYIARDRYAFLRGVFDAYPCDSDEAEAVAQRARLRTIYEVMPDDVRKDIGLLCRIADAYAQARKPKPPDSA